MSDRARQFLISFTLLKIPENPDAKMYPDKGGVQGQI